MTADYLLNIGDLAWHPLGDRTYFRLLRHTPENGHFAIILRMDAGAHFLAHKHYGPAEFLMLKGELRYGDTIARPGNYGWEGMYARHGSTRVEVDTELMFTGFGPVVFHDDDGNTVLILDGGTFADIASGAASNVKITTLPAAAS